MGKNALFFVFFPTGTQHHVLLLSFYRGKCPKVLVPQEVAYLFDLDVVFQVIAKFLALMYSYLNISMSKSIVPDGIKGRPIHLSFPMTLFMVGFFLNCSAISFTVV